MAHHPCKHATHFTHATHPSTSLTPLTTLPTQSRLPRNHARTLSAKALIGLHVAVNIAYER